MEFGLMTQFQMPKPWTGRAEQEAHRNCIQQAVAGEESGFRYFWIAEQHFMPEIGHTPCPEITLAVIGERTSVIRLGFAVMLVSIHHPFALAERVGTLDVLSGGRVELGMGRGSSPYMLEGYGIDPAQSPEIADEATRALLQIFRDGEYFKGFRGKYFDMPARSVVPQVVQRPHPPLWIAASNHSTYELAARKGVGVIGSTRLGVAETKVVIDKYRLAVKNVEPASMTGSIANEKIAAYAIAACHEDDQTGRDLACSAYRWYNGDNKAAVNSHRFANVSGGVIGVAEKVRALSNDELIENGMAIGGNPDTICRQLEKWQNAGLDQIIFLMQAGNTSDLDVRHSIKLIGDKVIPQFC